MTAITNDVKRLADPAWEGRGPGTRGLDQAGDYLAERMRAIGLEPGGDDGTWFQTMEVTTGVDVGEPCAVLVHGKSYAVGAAMQPLGFSTNGTLRAPVVFAGYGITAPGYDYDDYAGLDVRDKLVLVLTNEPGEMDSLSRFDGSVNTPHAELRTKAINAREHGALGLIVVDGPKFHADEPLRRPKSDGGGYMTSKILACQVAQDVADQLIAPAHTTLATLQEAIDAHGTPHSLALPESATVTVTVKRAKATIRNVGWIRGADTLRTLVVGAHYDHLGYGGESSLDPDVHAPHVGADDNASGVAALLAVASHAAAGRRDGRLPRHNLVFCAFTGEEIGLVGSSHYTESPTRPLESVEAMLNMDMVGRLRDNRLMVMGVGTAAQFTDLVAAVNQAAGKFDLKTSSDGFGPSDHSSFYKARIPVLMLFTGSHADYHKASDTWDKLDYPGLGASPPAAALVDSSMPIPGRPIWWRSPTARWAGSAAAADTEPTSARSPTT